MKEKRYPRREQAVDLPDDCPLLDEELPALSRKPRIVIVPAGSDSVYVEGTENDVIWDRHVVLHGVDTEVENANLRHKKMTGISQ
jgi:hypothetical protein